MLNIKENSGWHPLVWRESGDIGRMWKMRVEGCGWGRLEAFIFL
jgi:hypothetical protein